MNGQPEQDATVAQRVFVVVAAHNEASCIGEVLRILGAQYPNTVVVDDGSTDTTLDEARQHARYALRHIVNRGQGAALQTGIDFALHRGADFIVTFDADGQHCVEDIMPLLDPVVRGECEVALGSRFLGKAPGMPRRRRMLLRIAVLVTRLVSRVPVTDVHNGLRAFSRRAAQTIRISMDRMAHASEILDCIKRSGLTFREVPVRVVYTPYSLAKGQPLRGAVRIVVHYLMGRMGRGT